MKSSIFLNFIFLLSGAAVALFCSMHTQERLGGCVALSTMLPEKDLPDPSQMVNKGQRDEGPGYVHC